MACTLATEKGEVVMNIQQWLDDTRISETDIVKVLSNRFGDGVVYLSKNMPRKVYNLAVKRGFISADGYVTRKGRTLLAQFHSG
jgi:hypothetical protein